MNGHDIKEKDDCLYVLITGANSGLGLASCHRLIDEFITTRPAAHTLRLLITTRSEQKGIDTLFTLQTYLQKLSVSKGTSEPLSRRIKIGAAQVDLTSLRSVERLSKKLLGSIPRLDVLILNAGIGGWTGINWLAAIYEVFTDFFVSVTYPTYKYGVSGIRAKPQLLTSSSSPSSNTSTSATSTTKDLRQTNEEEEPPLGEIFCANVFGHYMLTHQVTPLLQRNRSPGSPTGRIIWLSSVEAGAKHFSPSDFQCMTTDKAYESSKRLVDILAMNASLPGSKPWVDRFFSSSEKEEETPSSSPAPSASSNSPHQSQLQQHSQSRSQHQQHPHTYVAHPGICRTSIYATNPLITLFQTLAIYLARFLGSPWHTIDAYKGAVSVVWLALASQATLDGSESRDGIGKWGSATDMWGNERVVRTEVDGWGYGGGVEGGEAKQAERDRKGRRPDRQELTEESKVAFEELGRTCWREMEELRVEWEGRLGEQ